MSIAIYTKIRKGTVQKLITCKSKMKLWAKSVMSHVTKKKANLTGTALEWSVPRPVDFKIVHVFQGKVGSMIVGNMIFCMI